MTCAGDTVGEHLAAALWNAGESAAWHRRACELRAEADQYLFVPKRRAELWHDAERAEGGAAFRAGLAAGHAFRAAELAYDAGLRDGSCRRLHVDVRDDIGDLIVAAQNLTRSDVDLSDVDPAVLDLVFPERKDDGT